MTRIRRRRMTFVDVWAGDGPEIVRQFRRGCTAAYLLYTEGLRACPEQILATASWTRLFPSETLDLGRTAEDYPLIDAQEPTDGFGFSESVRTLIDFTILDAPDTERPVRYLNWLHRNMLAVARARSWGERPLDFAYAYALQRRGIGDFRGPVKTSPDRKHRAALSLFVDIDSESFLRIEVSDKAGSVVARAEQASSSDFYNWRRFRSHFGWRSPRLVGTGDKDPLVVPRPYVPRFIVDLDDPQSAVTEFAPRKARLSGPAAGLTAAEVRVVQPATLDPPWTPSQVRPIT